MKTELSIPSVVRYLSDLSENCTADQRTQTITEIYESGWEAGMNDTLQNLGPEECCVGNKVCETLAETMKAEFLGQIFDKYSESDFRRMVKNHDLYLKKPLALV